MVRILACRRLMLTLGNKLQWNFNKNTKLFIHKNESEDIVFEMAPILPSVETAPQISSWCADNLIHALLMLNSVVGAKNAYTTRDGCTLSLARNCLAVRGITKSSSTFSATNISSNMIWFLQLHDTIKMKSNHTGSIYNHNDKAIRSHIMIYNRV